MNSTCNQTYPVLVDKVITLTAHVNEHNNGGGESKQG